MRLKRGFLGKASSLKVASSRNFTQLKWSFCDSLSRVVFKEWLVHSVFPENGEWNRIWKYQGMLRALDRVWETWEVNSGPLSDWREVGIPSWWMISWRRRVETGWALLLVVKNASTQPEKMSTKTRRYLAHLTVGMWIKSSCQSVPEKELLSWLAGKGGLWNLELGSDIWQIFARGSDRFKKHSLGWIVGEF